MSPTNSNAALLIARLAMAALFLVSGLGKLADPAGFTAYMTSGGLPAILAWPVIAFEILGAVALILGFQVRYVALALGLFSLVSGVMFHTPTDPAQQTNFLKNLALFGGYIALALTGPGAWAIGNRRG